MYDTSIKSTESKNFIRKYPLIFKKFRVLNHLSKGAFSDIYAGINILTKEKVAIKVEDRFTVDKYLETECFFLFSLKGLGIPKVISFGHNKEYDILVMPLLGKSLHEIQRSKNFNFEFKDICLMAIQIIERIQWVHSQKIIHRDIKPDNFLIGLNDPNIIYLIDFGLSKKYRSSTTGNHIKNSKLKKFVGSLRYASINASKLREQSRRDDLESIGYMLIYLIKGKLPWDSIKVDNKRSSYIKLSLYKKNLEPEILCRNLPKEFAEYIRYVKNLNFEDEPDYNYVKNLFRIMLRKQGIEENRIFFSWINESNISKIQKVINLSKRNSSSRGRILKKIRKLMDNRRSMSEMHNNIKKQNTNEDEDEEKEFGNTLIKNNKKNIVDENDEDIKYQNYVGNPVVNNYKYNFISTNNNINNINNNKLYHNQYKFNLTSYNPFIIKNNENNKIEIKPNLNINYIKVPKKRNNNEINYNQIFSYNNDNQGYQENQIIGNYKDTDNKYKAQNYYNNYNIKVMNNNNYYITHNLLNKSCPNKIEKIYNYPNNNQNNISTRFPQSQLNTNMNIKNSQIKKQTMINRFKNLNILNISPFKKRNNKMDTSRKNNNNKFITENDKKTSQLMDEIKMFNKKYNIKFSKNDKFLIKNKMRKTKMSQFIPTNKSADNNKIRLAKNNFKYQGNNTDKNCIIF